MYLNCYDQLKSKFYYLFLPWGFLRYPVIDWNYFLHECLHFCPIIHSHALNIRKYSTCTNIFSCKSNTVKSLQMFLQKNKVRLWRNCAASNVQANFINSLNKKFALHPCTRILQFDRGCPAHVPLTLVKVFQGRFSLHNANAMAATSQSM